MNLLSKRTILAGFAGGLALNFMMILTFRLLGFGMDGGGILLDPSLQSSKLIAVWTEIDPIPLVVNDPIPIIIGLLLFGIGHSFIYKWISHTWPQSIMARTWRMALLIFFFSFLFWEFFTPFNLFGEPIIMIGLELIFWAIIAVSEAFSIVLVSEIGQQN